MPDTRVLKRNSRELSCPNLASGDGKSARQRSRGHDFARSEGRVVGILRQRLHEMAQGKQRPVEDIRRKPVVNSGSITEEIDLEACELMRPRVPARLGRVARPDEQPTMQAKGGDGVRRPERPARED